MNEISEGNAREASDDDTSRDVDQVAGVGEPATAEDTRVDATAATAEDAGNVDVKKARAEAAKYRQRAKDAEAQLQDVTERATSLETQLQDANATIEGLQANLRTAHREMVATKHNFSDELMDFVTGDTFEEMEASAQKLRAAMRHVTNPMGLAPRSSVKLGDSVEASSTATSWAAALKFEN